MSRLTRIIRDVDVTRPTTPGSFAASPTSATQINLSWTDSTDPQGAATEAVTGVAGYRVYRNGSIRTTTTSLSFSDTGLTEYTQYSYYVAAIDSATTPNESVATATLTPRTLDITAPTAPTITASVVSTSALSVALTTASTDSGSGVSTYQLEYKRNADSTWTVQSSSLTSGSFPVSITGLSSGTLYDTRCRATDVSGNAGSYSATSQATTTASSTWTVNFSETLGYTKPYVRPAAGLGSAYPTTFANTYYVNAAAGGGGNGTQGSPWNSLSSLSGQTTSGGCRVYIKGNFGQLSITSGTFAGTAGSYILFQPWPSDSTPAVFQAANGGTIGNANKIEASGWSRIIFDGGQDMLIEFRGASSSSGNQNQYALYFNSNHITAFRCKLNGNNKDGPIFGAALNQGANTTAARLVNCEVYNSNYYGVYTGGGANIDTGNNAHFDLEFLGNVFHDIVGQGIQIEPRMHGGTQSSGVLIDGNVFRRVAYSTVNGSAIPSTLALANAGGANIPNCFVTNNIAWGLGGGFIGCGFNGTQILNNTIRDYAKLSPITQNSHGIGTVSGTSSIVIRNNIIHTANNGASSLDIRGSATQSNNVTSGSVFQSTDENNANYLKPTGGTVVDAGFNVSATVTSDYLGGNRLQGSAVNVGAFES